MQKRTMGNSSLEVSALGLGCMRMSFGDKPIGDKAVTVELTPDDLREIESAMANITVQGNRY